jgi:hypothetical protein
VAAIVVAAATFLGLFSYIVYRTGRASEDYGRGLQDSFVANTSDVPFGLGLLVNPERGFATVGDESECVTKIRGNVISNGNTAVVLKELDAFVADSICLLSVQAFGIYGTVPSVIPRHHDISPRDIEQFNTALARKVRVMPDSDFFTRALTASLDLCTRLDRLPPTAPDLSDLESDDKRVRLSVVFGRFQGNDLVRDPYVKTVVLQLTGQQLCPEHRDSIRDYLDYVEFLSLTTPLY